jgi:hypothetical protein
VESEFAAHGEQQTLPAPEKLPSTHMTQNDYEVTLPGHGVTTMRRRRDDDATTTRRRRPPSTHARDRRMVRRSWRASPSVCSLLIRNPYPATLGIFSWSLFLTKSLISLLVHLPCAFQTRSYHTHKAISYRSHLSHSILRLFDTISYLASYGHQLSSRGFLWPLCLSPCIPWQIHKLYMFATLSRHTNGRKTCGLEARWSGHRTCFGRGSQRPAAAAVLFKTKQK